MEKTASQVKNLHELMVKLGKLAWVALNRERKQLFIYKVRIMLYGRLLRQEFDLNLALRSMLLKKMTEMRSMRVQVVRTGL